MTMTNIGDWKSLAIILPNSVRLEKSGYNLPNSVRLEKSAIILPNSVRWWMVDGDSDDVVGSL